MRLTKRILTLELAFIYAFVLSGCCISHDWEDATCTKPKTCSECGKTEGDPLGHKWEKATCTKPKTCSRCEKKDGDPLGHKWLDATCTEPAHCAVCGLTEGGLGHEAGVWQKEGTEYILYCKNCGAEMERSSEDPLAGNTVGKFVERYNALYYSIAVGKSNSEFKGAIKYLNTIESIPSDGVIDVGNGVNFELNVNRTPVSENDELQVANFAFYNGVDNSSAAVCQTFLFILSALPDITDNQLQQLLDYICGDSDTPPTIDGVEINHYGLIIQLCFK